MIEPQSIPGTKPVAKQTSMGSTNAGSSRVGSSNGTTSSSPRATGKKSAPNFFKRRSSRFGLAALLVIVAYLLYHNFSDQKTTSILTATVHQGQFNIVVVETGELRAKHSVNIGAPPLSSGGRAQLAIRYLAPEGTTVDSGTLIVSFDPQDMSKALSDKQDQLTLDKSDLEKTKAQEASDKAQAQMDLENAQLSYELAKLTNESMKFESQSKQREAELDMKKADLALAQAKQNVKNKVVIQKSEMENLKLKVTQDEAAIARIQTDVQRLDVHAPSSGLLVYNNNWTTGRKFAKGDQIYSAQALGSLPDLSEMQAVIQVNEVDISKVKEGQSVDIRLDAFPDKTFKGKVTSVGSIGNKKDNNPSVKVFEVIVDLTGTDPILKPGMTVSARIAIDQLDNVVSIPLECVYEDNDNTIAYVQNGGSWDKRAITLGAKNDNFVVVTKGLKAGEKIAMTDPTQQPTSDASKGTAGSSNPKPGGSTPNQAPGASGGGGGQGSFRGGGGGGGGRRRN
jgi:RND family efflux transporter MFP subunit